MTTAPDAEDMLPGERCTVCTQKMERVTESSWMCVRCRRNVYWFEELPEDSAEYLQREWNSSAG